MTIIRTGVTTNFAPQLQRRATGMGRGRKLFQWRARMPWLLIIAERTMIKQVGSADALLAYRDWKAQFGITPDSLAAQLEVVLPGIGAYLAVNAGRNWRRNLLNRVYKMYYNGTSARGAAHDPNTRAAVSSEHWRSWATGSLLVLAAGFDSQLKPEYPRWKEWL